MGTSAVQQARAAAGAGSYGPPYAADSEGGSSASSLGPSSKGTSLQDPLQQSLLRALSGKWQFGA
jgi:hypothetical protein